MFAVHLWTLRVIGIVPPTVFAFAFGWVRGGVIPAVGLAVPVGGLLALYFWFYLKDNIRDRSRALRFARPRAVVSFSLDRDDWYIVGAAVVGTALVSGLGLWLGGLWAGLAAAAAAAVGLVGVAVGYLLDRSGIGYDLFVWAIGLAVFGWWVGATFSELLASVWLGPLVAVTLVFLLISVTTVEIHDDRDSDQIWFHASSLIGMLALLVFSGLGGIGTAWIRDPALLLLGLALGGVLWTVYGGLIWLDGLLARLITVRNERLPLRLPPFLTAMVPARILRERSGGYQFTHRYLLESLAGDDEIAVLIGALGDRDRRERAIRGLVGFGPRAVKPLIGALADAKWDIRYAPENAAENALVKLGDVSVEPLIGALADADSRVPWKAAAALGKLGDVAVEPLIGALTDKNWNVRRLAAEALGKLGDERALEPLIRALADAASDMQREAAWALGKLGDARALEPLIGALAHGSTKTANRVSAWTLMPTA